MRSPLLYCETPPVHMSLIKSRYRRKEGGERGKRGEKRREITNISTSVRIYVVIHSHQEESFRAEKVEMREGGEGGEGEGEREGERKKKRKKSVATKIDTSTD